MTRMVALAAESVRRRKIRSGSSGAGERASIPTNAPDQCGGSREQADRDTVAPAMLACPGDRVDEHHQAGGDRDGAGEVEVPTRERGPALAQEPWADSEDGGADRQVDEEIDDQLRYEVRMPPSSTPAAPPTAGDGTPDGERDIPLAPLAEGGDDDRQRGRREQSAAEPLQPRA